MTRFMKFAAAITLATLVIAGCGGADEVPEQTSPTTAEATPPADAPTGAVTEPADSEPEYEVVALDMAIQEGSGSNLPAVVARDEGFFDKYGLDVSFVPLAGSALLPSFAAGEVQFVNQAVQLVGNAIQQGVQLRFFCGNYPTNWSVIIARAEAGLPTTAEGATWQEAVQALEGLSVGVAVVGATQEHWIVSLLRAAGMDADAVTLVPVGVGGSAIAAMEAGQVDTVIGYSFIKQQLVATGEYVELLTFDETGEEVLGSQMNTGWIADEAWLDENPDVAERLCMALGEAMDWAKDRSNEDRLHEILGGPDFGIDDPAVRSVITEEGGIVDEFSTTIECDRLERAADFFVEFGTFTEDPPVNCETAVWRL